MGLRKICFLLLVFFSTVKLSVISSYSAPHEGDEFDLLQPDGSYISVLVWGDEYYQHIESHDGYTLIKDPATGWISYAELDAAGEEFVSTGIPYEKLPIEKAVKKHGKKSPSKKSIKIKKEKIKEKRTKNRKLLGDPALDILPDEGSGETPPPQAAPPPAVTRTGSYLGLTLLIDFPDAPATVPRSDLEAFCNEIGYTGYTNYGSIRDYFRAASEDLLDYTNHVTAYYTAKNNKSYYTDETIAFGTRARELVIEALRDLDTKGFNFAALSTESGRIIAINAMYAGAVNNAWSKGLWPHAGTIPTGGFSADGVSARRYQISSIGTNLSIRTFIHENGHLLMQWRDLYDYGSESNGVGNFCIMAAGGNNKRPVLPNPYFRQLSGWETTTQVNSTTNAVFTRNANTNATVRYGNPANTDESFFMDIRHKSGWNYYYPGSGLVIWHVEGNNGSNDNEQMTCEQHYLVSVEQADGLFHLENKNNSGATTDVWTTAHTHGFSDTTTPNSDWWCHGASGLRISEISAAGTVMSYRIGSGPVTPASTRTSTPLVSPTPSCTRTATPTEGVPQPSSTNTPALSTTSTPSRTPTRTATTTATRTATRTVTRTATPVPAGYSELQAEAACYFDGISEAVRTGYTGTGYVNLTNEAGSSVVFYINSDTAQPLTLTVRYANGSINHRDMQVLAGSNMQPDLIFTPTGAWSTWSTTDVIVNLEAGRNEIIFVSVTGEGGPHLDRISFNSISAAFAPCIPPAATGTPTPTATPVITNTATRTTTETRSPTHEMPSYTATHTVTATNSQIATNSSTPALTDTPPSTATRTPTATPTRTVIPATFSITPTRTITPIPEGDTLKITKTDTYPNPLNTSAGTGMNVGFYATKRCETVSFAIYTRSYRKIISSEKQGPLAAGYNTIALPGSVFADLSPGIYYGQVEAKDEAGKKILGKAVTVIIIR